MVLHHILIISNKLKKETIERYGRNLVEIGQKQGLIEVYNHLENYFGIDMGIIQFIRTKRMV